ncbi:MAG: hypothetical protein ACOC8E_08545 [Planctomycetota bacterium]
MLWKRREGGRRWLRELAGILCLAALLLAAACERWEPEPPGRRGPETPGFRPQPLAKKPPAPVKPHRGYSEEAAWVGHTGGGQASVVSHVDLSSDELLELREHEACVLRLKVRDPAPAEAWEESEDRALRLALNRGEPTAVYEGGAVDGEKEITVALPTGPLRPGSNTFRFSMESQPDGCRVGILLDRGPTTHTTVCTVTEDDGKRTYYRTPPGDLAISIERKQPPDPGR